MHVRLDGQVRAVHHRVQVADRRRCSAAPLRVCQLEIADTVLLGSVEVVAARDGPTSSAEAMNRSRDRISRSMRLLPTREGATSAVPVVLAAFLVLGALEIGERVVIAPAGASELAPNG